MTSNARASTTAGASLETEHAVAALYKFAPHTAETVAERVGFLQAHCVAFGITGTLLLAPEGINGTISAERRTLERTIALIESWPGFRGIDVKWSSAEAPPFIRMKVRAKPEIVTMRTPDLDPARNAGTYVEPHDWNALIDDPEVLVIDTRNAYEVALGSFDRAIDPGTAAFADFPGWVEAQADLKPGQKIAMFCTGGIRCEKATAFLTRQGFDEVYHLKGGILGYFDAVPPEETRWRGECFVFDRRVAVRHGAAPGAYQLCSVCRMPFETGVSGGGYADVDCPACQESQSQTRLARAGERRRQLAHAQARGADHLGPLAQAAPSTRTHSETDANDHSCKAADGGAARTSDLARPIKSRA
ncbi:MAG: rhodanese-related sulfurtransferase [Pseudomonadota bacterium]